MNIFRMIRPQYAIGLIGMTAWNLAIARRVTGSTTQPEVSMPIEKNN